MNPFTPPFTPPLRTHTHTIPRMPWISPGTYLKAHNFVNQWIKYEQFHSCTSTDWPSILQSLMAISTSTIFPLNFPTCLLGYKTKVLFPSLVQTTGSCIIQWSSPEALCYHNNPMGMKSIQFHHVNNQRCIEWGFNSLKSEQTLRDCFGKEVSSSLFPSK